LAYRMPNSPASAGGWMRRPLGTCDQPVALRMVYEAAQSVRIPVIGLGGSLGHGMQPNS